MCRPHFGTLRRQRHERHTYVFMGSVECEDVCEHRSTALHVGVGEPNHHDVIVVRVEATHET